MNNTLVILGAGGHGKVAIDVATEMKLWDEIVVLDDNVNTLLSNGLKVKGKLREVNKYIQGNDIFVAIGDNKTRESVQEKLELQGARIPVLVHPSSTIGSQVNVASGTIIMAGVIINGSTKIGKGCIINTGSTIDHENEIGNFVHISPGVHLAGSVRVGCKTWLGIGSVVSNNINIIEGCILGAGTVVIRDINIAGTYIGVPARRI